jgi:hypothetical protein
MNAIIAAGPFASFVGTFEFSAHTPEGRALLSITLFGKAMRVEIDTQDIVALPEYISREQANAIQTAVQRWKLDERTLDLHPMFGGNGAAILNVGPMWLAIESDGYTHS